MGEKKTEKQLINKVLITKKEYSEAMTFLYEEYGPIIQIWNEERKNEAISNYWLDRGKEDVTEEENDEYESI